MNRTTVGNLLSHQLTSKIVVVIAYERGSFTRDSNCSASVGEVLVFFFWVAYGMWSPKKRTGPTWRFDPSTVYHH